MAKIGRKAKSKKALMRKRRARKIAIAALLFFSLAAVAIRLLVMEVFVVSSSAMSPVYRKGDVVAVMKYEMLTQNNIHRGDIVYARFETAGKNLLRRVSGMPGDLIDVRGDETYLVYTDAGGVMREKALGSAPGLQHGTLPEGAYLLLSDDLAALADDGRTLGLVYFTDITAKAGVTLWPPSHMFR